MKNVYILTAAQALAGCSTIMLVAFGGIAGARIAPFPGIATLPLSLSILSMAAASLPAALMMQRIGRRPAFIGSACALAIAACVCALAIGRASFPLLCLAGVLLGANMAFVQQYRFAATEFVAPEHAGRAVATVLLGTLAAAIIGPFIGQWVRDAGGWREYTASYLALAVLCLAAAVVLTKLENAPQAQAPRQAGGRPLTLILRQPAYLLAVVTGVAAYAVMSFIMTATPISMHEFDGFSGSDTSLVITAHLIGMYLPSLFTPLIIRFLGLRAMMLTGIAAMILCVAIAAWVGRHFVHYFWALVLLGVGWNLMFVAATTQLTSTYRPEERFRAQGCNDLAVFGTQGLASLAAGAAIQGAGWENVNLLTLPLLGLVALALLLFSQRETR
jgi:predicted MFS family arabinose efflux permease